MKQITLGRIGRLTLSGAAFAAEGLLRLFGAVMDDAARDRGRSTLRSGEVRTAHGIEPLAHDSHGQRVGAISRSPDVDSF